MTKMAMQLILSLVKYKDWRFKLSPDGRYMQVEFTAPDLVTGSPAVQRGRKWIMSPHMTKSEVVCTAFKAVMTAEEHEIRETFRYRQKMIFGPHFDVDALVGIAGKIDVRENPDEENRDSGLPSGSGDQRGYRTRVYPISE